LVRRREDDRAVLGPDVSALAIQRRRVVEREEQLDEIAIRDHVRVERHLNHFGVAGPSGAHGFVRGIRRRATRVPRLHLRHAFEPLEHGLDAPEATSTEGCELLLAIVHGHLSVRPSGPEFSYTLDTCLAQTRDESAPSVAEVAMLDCAPS